MNRLQLLIQYSLFFNFPPILSQSNAVLGLKFREFDVNSLYWSRLFIRIFILLGASLSLPIWAYDFQVVDQNGEAVKNAVVSIPEGTIDLITAEPAVMDQVQRQFVPFVLAVEKGREVVFPNSDNIRHHVYSFSKPKNFQIKLYKGVPKQPLRFDQEGVVVLGCNIHDSMIGYIFVSPWPNFQVTSENGQVSFKANSKELAVWHPWMLGQDKPQNFLVSDLEKSNFKIQLQLTPPKPIKKLKSKFKKYYGN